MPTTTTTAPSDSFHGVPPYMIALYRMYDDQEAAGDLASLLEASSFPDRESRDLFKILATDGPKGPSIITLRSAIEQSAPHCIPIFKEVVDSGTILKDLCSNAYLAERVADEGKRTRLARSAKQTIDDLAAGKPTTDILAKADMQRAAVDLAAEKNNSRFVLRDDAEIESLPRTEWLIEGILPAGAMAVIVGPPGSFKSFVVLDQACHVQTGLDWCNRRSLVGQVVYLAGEGGGGINKRMAAWRAQNNYKGRVGIHFLTNALTLNDPTDLAGLIRSIESRGLSPALIVVDTLSRFLQGDENTAKDMGAFVRGCDELRWRFRCAVIVIHHSGKDAAKGARGSSALQGATDVEIVCERAEGEMSVTLSASKPLRDGTPFRPITLGAVQIAGSLALLSSGPNTKRLSEKSLDSLLALRDNDTGSGLTHAEWLDVSDQGKSTFNKSLRTLKEWVYLRIEKGRYSVNEAGLSAIRSTQSTTGFAVVHSDAQVSPLTRGYIGTPVVDQGRELDLEVAVA